MKSVKLFGEEVEVKAMICNLPGVSGHADKEHLTEWLKAITPAPQKVFVVHGDDATVDGFVQHLKDTLGVDAYGPYSGDTFDLITGKQTAKGDREKVQKKQYQTSAKNSVYDRLVAAGQRLLVVIKKCQGMANKDLAKFADQINALCDKWER